jgi:hypothetical protein
MDSKKRGKTKDFFLTRPLRRKHDCRLGRFGLQADNISITADASPGWQTAQTFFAKIFTVAGREQQVEAWLWHTSHF